MKPTFRKALRDRRVLAKPLTLSQERGALGWDSGVQDGSDMIPGGCLVMSNTRPGKHTKNYGKIHHF